MRATSLSTLAQIGCGRSVLSPLRSGRCHTPPARRMRASVANGQPGHQRIRFPSVQRRSLGIVTPLLPWCRPWTVVRRAAIPVFVISSNSRVQPADASHQKRTFPLSQRLVDIFRSHEHIVHTIQRKSRSTNKIPRSETRQCLCASPRSNMAYSIEDEEIDVRNDSYQ